MKEAWYKNTTSSDLLLSDLELKIPKHKTVNLYQLKPTLTVERIAKSEESGGLLFKSVSLNKLIKLPFAPPPKQAELPDSIKESKGMIPSRVKTSVVIDASEQGFLEDIDADLQSFDEASATKYADLAEGISDPLSMGSDDDTFNTIVIPSNEEEVVVESVDEIDSAVETVGTGKTQYFVVNPIK